MPTTTSGLPYPAPSDLVIDAPGALQDLAEAVELRAPVVPDAAWRAIGGPGQPAFLNGWANTGGSEAPARFRRDAGGFVHLEGVVEPGTAGQPVFTLPTGYRPTHPLAFAVAGAAGPTAAFVDSSGAVSFGGSLTGPVHLSGVTFHGGA